MSYNPDGKREKGGVKGKKGIHAAMVFCKKIDHTPYFKILKNLNLVKVQHKVIRKFGV